MDQLQDANPKTNKIWRLACLMFAFLLISTLFVLWIIPHRQAADTSELLSSPEIISHEASCKSPLPDTMFPSVLMLEYEIRLYDTLTPGTLEGLEDLYLQAPGVFTFRGGPARDHPRAGRIEGTPSGLTTNWIFRTPFDTTQTDYGRWGGGTGWTGQPLRISWPDSLKYRFDQTSDTLIYGTPDEEIIIASLCGDLLFLHPKTGKPTRKPITIGNTLKGTPGIDPSLNGLMFAGHGIPGKTPIGVNVINLFTHQITQFFPGKEPFAWKQWGAFDASPIAAGQFLFWPGENGVVYKFLRAPNGLIKHTALRYRIPGKVAPGIESSMAVFKNYGYFGDNHGNILCINLNTMDPVWHYHNLDDSDATIVIEVEQGTPYLITGSQVDRQGDTGYAQITKLNATDGSMVWQKRLPCRNILREEKQYNGGMLATPLPGRGNCHEMIYCIIALPEKSEKADLIALRKRDGAILWKQRLAAWSWSSPVPFYNQNDSLFILTGDVAGNVYLFEGSTGKLLYKERIGQTFESTPLVIGNAVIFGSRGRNIYKLTVI